VELETVAPAADLEEVVWLREGIEVFASVDGPVMTKVRWVWVCKVDIELFAEAS
jgi:hypothetical protein